jgi:preprotein translocase subunit Sss1
MNELEAELKKTEAVLKKAEFRQLPPYKKLAIYFSRGLGLILGIGFIIILILAFS